MKIGILGAGNIARTMATTLNRMEQVECYAIGARDLERAEAFREEFGLAKAYGSYEELVQDSEIDLVYVATPHSHHYEHAKLALEHNKHVLCEKAFTSNAREAKALLDLAKYKNKLLAEAIWTRYMPSCQMLKETIESGIIGKVSNLTAHLGYVIGDVTRIAEPSLAGGALLDIGVYNINFASMAFGDKVVDVQSAAVVSDKGVDLQHSIILSYEDGKIATLNSTVLAQSECQGVIAGDKGYIVANSIINTQTIKIYDLSGKEIQCLQIPDQHTGFEFEVAACIEAIKQGKIECEAMPHKEILRIMELMDSLRSKWGVKFPMDEREI